MRQKSDTKGAVEPFNMFLGAGDRHTCSVKDTLYTKHRIFQIVCIIYIMMFHDNHYVILFCVVLPSAIRVCMYIL